MALTLTLGPRYEFALLWIRHKKHDSKNSWPIGWQLDFLNKIRFRLYFFLCYSPHPPVGQGLLIHEVPRSHSDTPQSVGLLWTSDQLVAETSTWQHTTLTTDRYTCPLSDSNPQSQQASGHRDRLRHRQFSSDLVRSALPHDLAHNKYELPSFIHSASCRTRGPYPLRKQVLHTVRSSASSFSFQQHLVSLRSFSSCLRLLPRLLFSSTPSLLCFLK